MGESGLVSSMLFQTKLALYTSYVIGATIPRGSIPAASFWDTNDPYLYLRVDRRKDEDYAILGGEDHKTGQVADTEKCYQRLQDSLAKIAPARGSITAGRARSSKQTTVCLSSARVSPGNLFPPVSPATG